MEFAPKPLHVFCTVDPTRDNGLSKPLHVRVGAANTESEAIALAAADLKAMMMPSIISTEKAASVKASRHYSIWRASWTRCELKL